MSSVLRGGYVDVEVHLVDEVASIDASSARSSASEIPASSPPATNVVEVGTLAPSPEIPPGPPGEYLRTGVRVRRGFASGRVVTRARTRFGAAVRREWGCRGGILRHLLHLEAACVERVELRVDAANLTRATARVRLTLPATLATRGRAEPKDAKTRAAYVAVFGHARRDDDDDDDDDDGSRPSRRRCAGFCGVAGCAAHDVERSRRGSLATALERLRPPPPTFPPIAPESRARASPADLPEDALDAIVARLDARAAAALASTCRGFRARLDAAAPGLQLRLHPHQVAGLSWMRRRERCGWGGPSVVDPRWVGPIGARTTTTATATTTDGGGDVETPYWLNAVSGEMSLAPPPSYVDSPGGLLCDEPGLGKTVTALALILARRGARPPPPTGARARFCPEKRAWFYKEAPSLSSGGGGGGGTPAGGATGERGGGGDGTPRRSKRSSSGTPVGHFAAIERAVQEYLSGRKRNRGGAASTSTSTSTGKRPSRLGPRAVVDDIASAPAPTRLFSDDGANATNGATKTETSSDDFFSTATAPPLGFKRAKASAAEREISSRNVAFFQDRIAVASHNAGSAIAHDIIEFVLMNASSAITRDSPLALPKWRFGAGDETAKGVPDVMYALGLLPSDATEKRPLSWAPPPSPHEGAGTESESIALDTDALDEALSLAREGVDGVGERRKVWLSSATLVVLPPVLISHWLEQIAFTTGGGECAPRTCVLGAGDGRTHAAVGLGASGGGGGGGGDGDDGDGDGAETRWLFGIEGAAARKPTTASLNELSGGAGDLIASSSYTGAELVGAGAFRARAKHDSIASFRGVDPSRLARAYDVVLVPVNRLSSEFGDMDSPLLRVHWQRIVFDEGHQLGVCASITQKLSMACALKSHARWVMTGTPTPATLKGTGVAYLQPLLAFLRQPPFGNSRELWMSAIQRPLQATEGCGTGAKGGKGVRGKHGGKFSKNGATRKGARAGRIAMTDRDPDAEFDGAAAAERASHAHDAREHARADAASRLASVLERTTIRTLKSDIRLPPLTREVRSLRCVLYKRVSPTARFQHLIVFPFN